MIFAMAAASPSQSAMARIDNVPLAERARALILQAILDKRFDQRLPSEEALAEMLNVSRTTVRTALQGLEQDGLITRKRAIGTTINDHVRPASLALHRMVGFDGLLREKGHEVQIDVSWRRGPAGSEAVEGFGIDADQDSLITEKSYEADGSLAIHIRDVVPWENLRDPDFAGEVPASIFEFSAAAWREPVDHAVAEIVPMVRTTPATTRLPVGDEPFTRLHERHYNGRGELLAVSIVDVDNAFFRFEVFRRR
jgi:GntR family transcriptional regulator